MATSSDDLYGADAGGGSVAGRILDDMLRPFLLMAQSSHPVQHWHGAVSARRIRWTIKQADTAMYRVGRGRGSWGLPATDERQPALRIAEHAMRQALGECLSVHYQPQVNRITGRIIGAER